MSTRGAEQISDGPRVDPQGVPTLTELVLRLAVGSAVILLRHLLLLLPHPPLPRLEARGAPCLKQCPQELLKVADGIFWGGGWRSGSGILQRLPGSPEASGGLQSIQGASVGPPHGDGGEPFDPFECLCCPNDSAADPPPVAVESWPRHAGGPPSGYGGLPDCIVVISNMLNDLTHAYRRKRGG